MTEAMDAPFDTPGRTRGAKEKLARFHSLLFGADATSEDDPETALGLRLRLVGFLDGERACAQEEDEMYINKMLSQVRLSIPSACQAIHPDRDILEQANAPKGFRFSEGKALDRGRISKSKYWGDITGPSSNPKEDSEPTSARRGAPAHLQATTSSVVEAPSEKPDFGNLVQRSSTMACSRLRQSTLSHFTDTSISKSSATGMEGGGAGLLQHRNSSSSTSRSLPAADLRPSDDGDDKLNQRRGRFSEFSQPSHKKPRAEIENRGDDYDSYHATHLKRRQSVRCDSDDDDDGGRGRRQKRGSNRKQSQHEDDIEDDEVQERPTSFVTARQQLAINDAKKNNGNTSSTMEYKSSAYANKTLGIRSRGPRAAFVPPVKGGGQANGGGASRFQHNSEGGEDESLQLCLESLAGPDGELPARLRNIEPKLLQHVTHEIMERDPNVRWDDIAGLEHAKKCVNEIVIWPLLRPDIFQGCRAPPKGLLLFGPPGTGKTMIGKAIAGEAKATFFSISASSIMSKWMGEAEKLVRALFGVAACRQPAVIFIDEVDSLLSQRKSDGETDSNRKIKTQFLVEMEGCGTGTEQVLVIGATNRPQELDEAARRRLSKRLYIPLPSNAARAWIVRNLLGKDGLLSLSNDEVDKICICTDGYSGSDMKNLVKEASMGPLREALMHGTHISDIRNEDIRPISLQDFMTALQQVRSSVSQDELGLYEDWNKKYGSLSV